MDNKKFRMWMWVLVGVAFALMIFSFTLKVKESNISMTGDEPASVQDVSTQGTTGGVVVTAPISYNAALIKYADRRIQLDKGCQAHPTKVTYKDNTGIMIDNRSAQTRTVKVGITFTIKPYGFKIVTLPDIYLRSATILVDCDKFQNVATVLIQE